MQKQLWSQVVPNDCCLFPPLPPHSPRHFHRFLQVALTNRSLEMRVTAGHMSTEAVCKGTPQPHQAYPAHLPFPQLCWKAELFTLAAAAQQVSILPVKRTRLSSELGLNTDLSESLCCLGNNLSKRTGNSEPYRLLAGTWRLLPWAAWNISLKLLLNRKLDLSPPLPSLKLYFCYSHSLSVWIALCSPPAWSVAFHPTEGEGTYPRKYKSQHSISQ